MRIKSASVAAWALCAVVFLPAALRAQDASVTGTVTDATNAVLPGVTVTALRVDSGNTFVDVTDAAGNYRLAVRPGIYKITAELTGFTPAVRDNFDLKVGQRVVLDLKLTLSTVQESVTVTGAAPVVNTSSSEVGGVIDRRQVEELPVNGRNFVDLTMMAKGSRANAVVESATPRNNAGGESQLNVDGQQVTQMTCCQDSFGNPRYSKDSIAEFEVVTNRFDATQGHSSGAQVNAITKSGTNRFSGTLSGYFRSDKFNSADFLAKNPDGSPKVLPYSDQQVSGTFGGPFVKSKLHFFGNYEYERNPRTIIFTTPWASFNKEDLLSEEKLYTTGLKLDYQLNTQIHAMFKLYRYHRDIPVYQAGGSAVTVSAANSSEKSSDNLFASMTQTFGSRAVNEVKGGYYGYFSWTSAYVDLDKFKNGGWAYPGAPRVNLNGIAFGGPSNLPQRWLDTSYQVRDDLTMLYSKAGRHELKIGGEFLHHNINLIWMETVKGILNATGGAIPANIEQLFPNQHDWHTWNLAALSPITINWRQSFGDPFIDNGYNIWSGWVQENWTVNPRLTVNLGLRYEYAPDQLNEHLVQAPFIPTPRKAAKDNLMPRVGGAYNVNGGKTAFRGGFGKYIAQNDSRPQWGGDISVQTRIPGTPNDGRPDFASNPFNGRPPTVAEVFAKGGDTVYALPAPTLQVGYSWQGSVGVQHQISETMSAEADYVWQGGRREMSTMNINLRYDPVTGINIPYTTVAARPFPDWGVVQFQIDGQNSDYHGIQTAFNKRFSQNYQVNATYSWSRSYDQDPFPRSGLDDTGVLNAPIYLGGERSLAVTDQRHRATINGIWQLPYEFQLSGLYFYGSGARFATIYGGDRTLVGAGQLLGRLGPNGLVSPRNDFVGRPLHRVDIRLLKRVKLVGTAQIDGMLEVFNLFNHENYGSYTTNLSVPANYGLPQQNLNVVYQPRIMQLGFRFVF